MSSTKVNLSLGVKIWVETQY